MALNIYSKATDVRNDFSRFMDMAVCDRPQFIMRTHDHLILMGEDILNSAMSLAVLHVVEEAGDNNKNIYSIEEISDIFVEASDYAEAKYLLGEEILEYAQEYYAEYAPYSRSPNRKAHIPYVIRALNLGEAKKVEDMLCKVGKN